MKTKISTIARTFQNGDHLTDAEMSTLAARLDEALAILKAVGASHVTSRGLFDAWMSCDTSLRNRKVAYETLDFNAQAAIQTELDSLLAIIRTGGTLPETAIEFADRLKRAGETIDAVAQDKIIAQAVWQPLGLIVGYLTSSEVHLQADASAAPAL